MVAEDEEANQRRLVRLLTECGCQVLAVFGNGLDAEDWLATSPQVDALFLDIRMPGLDGLSLRASVRPDLPVVFVTAHAEHAVDAFTLGVVDFLLKPLTTARLVKTLARLRRSSDLRSSPDKATPHASKFPVRSEAGMAFLELEETDFFAMEGRVVWVHHRDGQRYRTRWKTLGAVEVFFANADLLRIHRNLLIRSEAIRSVRAVAGDNRLLLRMAGGAELEASRSATPRLKARLRLRPGSHETL
jgi:DNA-binding LytR/AlgR family response regulator